MSALFGRWCCSQARLQGQTALVTGCSAGMGKEVAKDFYRRGAKVLMACRNRTKAQKVMQDIKEAFRDVVTVGSLHLIELDLSCTSSVRKCAKEVMSQEDRLDILVNNAGGVVHKQLTEDGFEMNFVVNYLSHFLLTILLLPLLTKSDMARIVNVTSALYLIGRVDFENLHFKHRRFTLSAAYCQSKLAQIYFTRELANRFKECGVNNVKVYCVHPGVVRTEIARNLDMQCRGTRLLWEKVVGAFSRSAKLGAQTIIYCSLDEKCAGESGLYYVDCQKGTLNRKARDKNSPMSLWTVSCNMLELPEDLRLAVKMGDI